MLGAPEPLSLGKDENHLSLLEQARARIAQKYDELGHTLWWRFLYSPSSTIHWSGQLLVTGLNPGGNRYVEPRLSVEHGNAYRVEAWGELGERNPLQVQVCRLFDRLAAATSAGSAEELMDSTATANFCPFRSPTWNSLPMRDASIEFAADLWRGLLTAATPATICIGRLTQKQLFGVYRNLGWTAETVAHRRIGWGSTEVSIVTLKNGGREAVVIGLPHLSRYQFFGRTASETAVKAVVGTVVARGALRRA